MPAREPANWDKLESTLVAAIERRKARNDQEARAMEDIMTITFGRRRLIVSLEGSPDDVKKPAFPEFENATDEEIIRFATRRSGAQERQRQEVHAALYGGLWAR
jgi:hypothetical protein